MGKHITAKLSKQNKGAIYIQININQNKFEKVIIAYH